MNIKVGDLVTVVHADHTIHASTVGSVNALLGTEHFFVVAVSGRLSGRMYFAHREGITWISGHHETNSPEIRSLAAAYLLAELPAGDSSA